MSKLQMSDGLAQDYSCFHMATVGVKGLNSYFSYSKHIDG